MKKIILLFTCLILIFSCKKEKKQSQITKNTITISGEITNLADSTLVILKRKKSKEVDTTYVLQNKFSFTVKKDTLAPIHSIIKFILKDKKEIPVTFWDDGKDLVFKGNINDPLNIKVINNKANKVFYGFSKIMNSYNSAFENLYKSKKSRENKNKEIKLYMDSINEKHRRLIFKNPNNSYSMYRVFFFREKLSNEEIRSFYNSLNPKFKSSKNGLFFKEYISIKKIKIGDHFKDFVARNLEGKEVKLSDFKGKIIILDFWANWCKWCHVQNKEEFSFLWEKYKNKEVVIISYALDKNVSEWKKSSKKDTITWVNLSNLKGKKDPVAYQYGVSALPHTFLIDKNGIIVKEFTGYSGENIIEKELKKLLKN